MAVAEAKVTQLESRIQTLEGRLSEQKGNEKIVAAMRDGTTQVEEYERQADGQEPVEDGFSQNMMNSPPIRAKSDYVSPVRRSVQAAAGANPLVGHGQQLQ